ncbi:Penicillin-insensitive transglycosylase / Penicillin-sensitive transpeptidase [Rhodovastum atsumiense]|uniref:Penicillin-binding protein 1A n=1 Tax=Rhodovastum atsumiense TaxID=504468 RepID=A0A5M6ISY4_9PROT|nr:PBP1A family penicillin-binding protein [Rhodovastum atsumiense]KAA5611009.1 PBP1A family penicillin-binding protein [Rhodovastum atsumiense]CAH2600209.1 Penicillin-insensitive transglycosylase / Penicillin-sensitive transpeptidase [Rhodovastum atsumiense]
MTDKLTAGARLVPPAPTPQPPPSQPPRQGKGKGKGKPRGALAWIGRIMGLFAGLLTLGVAGAVLAGFIAYQRFAADLPDVTGLRNYQPRMMSRIYAGDSRLLSELAVERRIFVPYTAIPEIVKRAFVSAEDQNFFLHGGVDPIAIARAAVTDLMTYRQGRRPIGASTITQQVAKNMLLGSSEVSLARKAREAILAIRLDQSLSKERILELYLNEIYLGLQSYGVAAAAQSYFNKPLDELTVQEAAFLAALPKAPNNYNPFRFPDAAKARRDWVLDRMAEDRVITAEQAAAAKAQPIAPAQYRRPDMVAGADYFAEEVRRRLIDRFGADQTTQGGLVVRTSLDPVLQAAADTALREGLMRYDRRRGGWRGPVARLPAGPALRTGWEGQLGQVQRPPGMLPDWKLAVVLEASDTEAKLGFVDRAAGAVPRVLPMQMADLGWARVAHLPPGALVPPPNLQLGPTPRRIADVVKPGDVVMAELAPATAGQGRNAGRPERLLLRQIPLVQGALVSIEPSTGRVLALSGGWSFEMSQFNRATQASRQPGSSFKPFVYLTALANGISPSQRFLDAPFVLDQGAAGKWRPNNYEMDFLGAVPLRIALEKSLNLVTVRVANQVGMDAVAQTAIGFRLFDNMPRVLPAALGAVETTVLREAGAYAGLAMGGREVVPTLIDSVQDRDGHVIWRAGARSCHGCEDPLHLPVLADDRRQVVDPASTFQLVMMMQGVVSRGTGGAAAKGLDRAIAGKTGTSQDFQDAWFGGFTPDLVTVVWIGFDTPTSLGNNETGGALAAPIWHDYMAVALKGRPKLAFVPPPGVALVAWDSGWGTVTDAFKPDQVPGASGPVGGGGIPQAEGPGADIAAPAPSSAGGVDSALGGLY